MNKLCWRKGFLKPIEFLSYRAWHAWFKLINFPLLKWTSQCPDLNPPENLWKDLKTLVLNHIFFTSWPNLRGRQTFQPVDMQSWSMLLKCCSWNCSKKYIQGVRMTVIFFVIVVENIETHVGFPLHLTFKRYFVFSWNMDTLMFVVIMWQKCWVQKLLCLYWHFWLVKSPNWGHRR